MFIRISQLAVLLCMSQVFAQKEEVGATPDVLALMNNMNRCRFQTVMCCFTRRRAQNGGGSPADNTDVCRAQGVLTQGDQEGATHCHGFTWGGRDAAMTDANKRKLLDFINTQDHFGTRGYFGAIGEYNKCDCIENMPIVSRSDCSELNGAANPKACDPRGAYGEVLGNGNNLADKYRSLGGNPGLFSVNLVGNCAISPPNAPALPDRGRPTPAPDTGYVAPKSSTQAPKKTVVPDTGYEPPRTSAAKTSTQAPKKTAVPDTGYVAPKSSTTPAKTSTQAPKKTAVPDTGYVAPKSSVAAKTSTQAPKKTAVPDTGYVAPKSSVAAKTSTQAPKKTAVPDTGYVAPKSSVAAKTSTQAPKKTPIPDTGYEAPKTSSVAAKSTTQPPKKTPIPDAGYVAPKSSTRAPAKTPVPETGNEAPRTTVAPAPVPPSTPTPAPDSGAPKDCDSKK